MKNSQSQFILPKSIEHYLAALSKLYALEGERQKQEILVNAQVRVVEEWSCDNWYGGTYGHALYLALPEGLYLATIRQKEDLQKQIKDDINKIHNLQNEFIEEVFLEMSLPGDQDWRRESGLIQLGKVVISPDTTKRIWGDNAYRVFLSHKSEVKKEAGELKVRLKMFGVSCFVAHEDINPTKEWQDEIENALRSMDAFIALLTEEYHDSLWTDQEVGFALCKGVPIIAVRLGRDPYGFIGKFQALSCDWKTAPREIVKLLIKYERMLNTYVIAVKECGSFDQANLLAEMLPNLTDLSEKQIQNLIVAFNENNQVRDSYGFNGKKPFVYGEGLVPHLNRLSRSRYELSSSGKIEVK